MNYHCELRETAAQPALTIRTTASAQNLPDVLAQGFADLVQHLGWLHAQPAGAPYVAYYNKDVQHLDIEIGIPVVAPLPGEGEIRLREIPAGKMAACLYTGPYNELESAYTALTEWVTAEGYTATGVAYEQYLNDPLNTPQQDLQTLILFPLKEN
jgi:effector-binding domain-containing protein